MPADRTTEILEDFQINSLNPNGGINVNSISPFETEDTLHEILMQLKIMNLHMALLTDTTIKKTEVE